MKILALDLGTQTGWAMTHESGIISGTQSFKHGRYAGGGMRFLKFWMWLDEIPRPDVIYFEEVRRHQGVDAAHVYGGFLAKLTSWCEKNDIPYNGVPVGTIKKHATGKGNGNKKLVIDAMIKKGHNVKDDNEADALALLYLAIGD